MAEFKLGRIRFVWKNVWATGTTYYKDDVVRFGGRTYICSVGHIAAVDFNTDLETSPTRWNQMTDGQDWKGDWSPSILYKLNDIVKYGGLLYICNDSHLSAATTLLGLEADQSKWTLFAEGLDWKDAWTANTRYKVNDLVKYGGYTYVCNLYHTSAVTDTLGLEADQSKWDEFNQGIEYKGTWAISTKYKINDVVKYGAGLWIAIANHSSTASFVSDEANWTQFVEGFEFENDWSSSTLYQPGDIVRYGGNQYVSKTVHSNANPTISIANWELFAEGIRFQSEWNISSSYKVGEVVRLNGYTYLATVDSPSNTYTITASDSGTDAFTTTSTSGMEVGDVISFSGTVFGGVNSGAIYYVKQVLGGGTTFTISTSSGGATFNLTTTVGSMTAVVSAMPPNTANWTKLNSGIEWQGVWADDTMYHLGDAVRYGANAYICILEHRSEGDDGSTIGVQGGGAANSRPDQDVTGTYWNILSIGDETAVMSVRGDMVYYGGAGPTRLPIGIEGQILTSNGTDPEWRSWGSSDHLYYVAPHGVDLPAPIHGITMDKPWRSIRYACEQILKGVRNPNAQALLELNRVFIQREVTEWIDYQISSATVGSIWYNFDYDEYKCERDTGYLVDRLIHDLGHGGNLKMRAAAQAYVNALGEGPFSAEEEDLPYSRLSIEADNDVAAFNYMLTVVENVLDQVAPAVNYQILNGDNSTAIVSQYTNSNLISEDVMTEVESLVAIVTDTLTVGNTSLLPVRYVPSPIISVKPGTYRETLPIIVPAGTCIQGDEVRAVNAGPSGSSIDSSDSYYTVNTFDRVSTIVGQIITGTTVTPTAGNSSSQNIAVPFASSTEATAVSTLVNLMKYNVDTKLGTMNIATLTDPVGYNTSYLVGYQDARKLLKENKIFLQEETVKFLEQTYADSKYGKTKTRRDIGYIIDALIYDLTYGGNAMSIQAGLAYFDAEGSANLIPASIKELTLAAINQLKEDILSVILNTPIVPLQTAIPQYRDTAGSVAAQTLAAANVDIIYNLINGSSTAAAPSITITLIDGTTTLTSTGHTLNIGDTVVPRTTANGLVTGTKYYVKTVATNTFTLAASFNGTAITSLSNGAVSIVADIVKQPTATDAVTTTTALIAAYTALTAQIPTIGAGAITTVTTAYPTLNYSTAKTSRDVAIVLEAVGYDFMFNSNYRTVKAAMAYLRANSVELYTTTNLKAATRLALTYAKTQAKASVGGNATAQARIETLMTLVDTVIFGASSEGSICQSDNRMNDYAALQLERNREFIVAEVSAHITATYTGTVTAATASTDVFTCGDTSWLRRNTAIRFSGTTFGGISTSVTYYVQNIVSSTTFKIATTRNATSALNIAADATGSMTISLQYNTDLCLRDVGTYIDALKYDLKYPGNYKSQYVSRYYCNAVTGSLEEDMFYLRDGTGVRNMTLEGLTGQLTPENEYGTSRTTAGSYCSLDPGWGPDDFTTWIIARSPYIQNCACFGTAAIGQKIDGNLHTGGNRSFVSNDFTQLISDGIGAWITNNGRAELVSVFSYYSHIGYLAENGGRIRGTNGNNSYGDFGSVAEGFDATEIANTAEVDNKFQFKAIVGSIATNTSQLLGFEFDNAGTDYTEIDWLLVGPGNFGDVVGDEFRDDAVAEVRLLDFGDDSSGQFGGDEYTTATGTAQGGSTTQITISAVDNALSTDYIGMKLLITGGAGVGQVGIIATFNSGTKIATVTRESTGAAGWDHRVPGTAIVSPDASSTYQIEPAISFSAPNFTSATATLPTSGTWTAIQYGNTTSATTGLTGTYSGTTGSGATWQVQRNGTKYFVTNIAAGLNYTRLDTITILGTSLGGTVVNNLVITITSVNSTTGAIQAFDFEGFGFGGRYIALRGGSQTGATSEDGISWTTRATLMPSAANWKAIAYGLFDDGSSDEKISKFVAIAGTSNNTTAASSDDGIIWTARNIVTSATWTDVTYGNGRFVAIANNSTTVRISLDGEVWDITGTLNSTGWTSITYGKGYFVAVKTGSTAAAYSENGIVWTDVSLPASSAWNSVAYGNNMFIAVATDSNSAAYSLTGTTWTATTIGSADGSTVGGYQQIRYGQGLFAATTYQSGVQDYSFVATTENGLSWTVRGVAGTANGISGWNAIAFGNPNKAGRWVVLGRDAGQAAAHFRTGARAKGRAFIDSGKIFVVRLTEPGSGYDTAPTMTITDPTNIFEAPFDIRLSKGALATPSFINRGTGYITCSAEIDSGDGYADIYQAGSFIAVRRITQRPVAGSNLVIANLPTTYKVVNVVSFRGSFDGSYSAFYQVSPPILSTESPENGDSITTRIRYSQVRLTGHDFLDIGTGGFDTTNYPNTPTQAPNQANETVENNGGRVFFTSTDQDGNFRVGTLFTIEQSTGVATLNADAFNISGLQELNLGTVTLGGGSASITEFSTDPFFTADSDSIVPTQRAIKAYIASQIGGGGASLNVNSVTAGFIFISTNAITTTTTSSISMNARFNFKGGVTGLPLAFNYFLT